MKIGQSIIYLIILIIALLATMFVDAKINQWLDRDGSNTGGSDVDVGVGDDKPSVPSYSTGPTNPAIEDRQKDGCYIGGCSMQMCGESPDLVSTCEWSPVYACYSDTNVICERQSNGSCGWTETEDLKSCIMDAKDTDINEGVPAEGGAGVSPELM